MKADDIDNLPILAVILILLLIFGDAIGLVILFFITLP